MAPYNSRLVTATPTTEDSASEASSKKCQPLSCILNPSINSSLNSLLQIPFLYKPTRKALNL